jgi:hypothetical protein
VKSLNACYDWRPMSKSPTAPQRSPLTLGPLAATRINAVEGLALSEDSQRMFADFERRRLSPEQRRRAILEKHARKA